MSLSLLYTVSQKTSHVAIVHMFAKYWPIFAVF